MKILLSIFSLGILKIVYDTELNFKTNLKNYHTQLKCKGYLIFLLIFSPWVFFPTNPTRHIWQIVSLYDLSYLAKHRGQSSFSFRKKLN